MSYRRTYVPLSSSYGSGRYGTSGSPSYLSSYRDRSGSRDKGGYGSDLGKSGYSSGTTPYSSRYSSTGEPNKGIPSIASKFGDTKQSKNQEIKSTQPTEAAKCSNSSVYNRTSSKSIPTTTTPRIREPTASITSRNKENDYSSTRTKDTDAKARDHAISRTRTAELPPSTLPESKSKRSSYTSRYISGPSVERSGYGSDAKSGYGSDYKSGYGSGYGSNASTYSRYNWSGRNSYVKENDNARSSYSRENSDVSNWRNRVYGNETEPTQPRTRPSTLAIRSETNANTDGDEQVRLSKRPFNTFPAAISKFSSEQPRQTKEDKKPELPSPNAIRVLPDLTPKDNKAKNKAPADFTSCSELSDDEEVKEKGKNYTPVANRPLRHLTAAPSLPVRKEVPPSQSLAPTPSFKLSTKLATSTHEIQKKAANSSKWRKEPEKESENKFPAIKTLNVNEEKSRASSPLPPRSPTLGGSRSTAISADTSPSPTRKNLGIANKDCRKSVLNMDVQPENHDVIRRRQEEKKEELRRLRRHRGQEDSSKPLINSSRVRSSDDEQRLRLAVLSNCHLQESLEDSSSSEEDHERSMIKPPVPPPADKALKVRVLERKHSKGKGDALRRNGSMKKSRERQISLTNKTSSASTSSSSDTESESKNYRMRNGSFSKSKATKTLSRDRILSSKSPNHRSRNNSECIQKSSSRNSVTKSRSGNSSKGSLTDSKSSLLSEKRLTLGPNIDIGEKERITRSPIQSTKVNHNASESDNYHIGNRLHNKVKQLASSSSSSSSDSDSSDDTSESAGEEGYLFSISKSRSVKKAEISDMPVLSSDVQNNIYELGDRTSPDGKEHTTRPNSIVVNDEDQIGLDKTSVMVGTLPAKYNENEVKSAAGISKELNSECNVANTTDIDVADANKDTNPENQTLLEGYSAFEWPDGSPVFARKTFAVNQDDLTTDAETIEEVNDHQEFAWPDGSPVLRRKRKPLYFRTQWDTETETEMEAGDWSDTTPPRPAAKMAKLPEEAEEDWNFEWPSSPEAAKKRFLKLCTEYETKKGGDSFDWPPSSPELPTMKDPKFISFTTDIDNLINDGEHEDSFADMEKRLGFSPTIELHLHKNGSDEVVVKEKAKENDQEIVELEPAPAEDKEENAQSDQAMTEEPSEDIPTEKQMGKTQESLKSKARRNLSLFLGKLSNIDETLGSLLQPLTGSSAIKATESKESASKEDDDDNDDDENEDEEEIVDKVEVDELGEDVEEAEEDSSIQEIDASEVKVHDSQANRALIDENIEEIDASAVIVKKKEKREALKAEIIQAVEAGLDDATLQVYRDGDYGTYLDLEGSLAEQADDFDGLTDSKRNAIVLRTQLSVRVHAIIEKLLKSEGRELRRALFSLKQIFQDDKDLVHAFVQNDGLKCLVKVGSSADHNYQTYILRALGQVMLYVDGMTGVSEHPETVRWLYTLVASKFRLVVKTSLKLLLVFVEYSEFNSQILIKAINDVDRSLGNKSWGIIMRILEGKGCPDTQLMIYAMTLINKTLNGVPDQDTYYDQTDALEEQGMETLIQKQVHNPNSDLDLLQQLTIYEAVLAYEDGDDVCRTRTIDPSIRQAPRYSSTDRDDTSRRKSRRHCSPPPQVLGDDRTSSDDDSRGHVTSIYIKGGLPIDDLTGIKHAEAGVTPALRRRRERAERHRTFINEQELISECRRDSISSDSTCTDEESKMPSWMLEMLSAKKEGDVKDIASRIASLLDKENIDNNNKKIPIELIADSSVKDILEKLSAGTSLSIAEQEKLARIGDVSGRIQRAKEGLLNNVQAKIQDNHGKKLPQEPPKKSENDLHWENLVQNLNRPLLLCDLDFSDLTEEDDSNSLTTLENGVPPPPPPPPPPPSANPLIPPPPPARPLENGIPIPIAPLLQSNGIPLAPPIGHGFGVALQIRDDKIQKTKKTIKLFWKEIREDNNHTRRTIWDVLDPIKIDIQRLEHLFESRAKDLASKKQQDLKGLKEVTVLDPKRSNVINIGMTKLPPPRTIKTAILKMDSSIINREGIEKLLLTMLPTPEEKQKIQDAAVANPELPLGSAEQFLMMLASISELPARLKLWLFKLDYDNLEKEVAESLMDLKQGLEDLQKNKTFQAVLSILLSIGNFLNGTFVKGFQLEYLSKVPEVKDTVHKHSLLHHLCHFVIEKMPDTTDLYSEVGAITRASKIDFDELLSTIEKLEVDCKASWDHLKAIAKHDGPTQMKLKMSEFLADSAERIIVLGIIYKRVIKRYHLFLTWMGQPATGVLESKPQRSCAVISEFALEYRTCRERVLQQIQKKANHRERNKTRGKMITEDSKCGVRSRSNQKMEKFRSRPKSKDEEADCDLRQLLNDSDVSDTDAIRGKNTWRRTRESKTKSRDESMVEALMLGADGIDDALLDSLVKTATKAPPARSTPRERKRSRHAERKSLRRTLKSGLSEEEKRALFLISAPTS